MKSHGLSELAWSIATSEIVLRYALSKLIKLTDFNVSYFSYFVYLSKYWIIIFAMQSGLLWSDYAKLWLTDGKW